MAGEYLAAIDQGTTGSTVLILKVEQGQQNGLRVVGRHTVDFQQHYPKPGWVEHDLDEVFASVEQAFRGASEQACKADSGFRLERVAACGITNQRETLCVFDRATSRPLARAIVWQCKRSTSICDQLRKDGLEESFRAKTGLLTDPYFSGTKATWWMNQAPEIAQALKNGQAVLGTIDTYLVARMTGGRSFVTEASNASRTLLYDIHKQCWDEELVSYLGLPSLDVLAEVRDSAGEFGRTRGLSFLPDGVPITGVLGDQQAAMAGQGCFAPGQAKCTYGTGAFLLTHLGAKAKRSEHGLLTTILWQLQGQSSYAFEGSAFIAGAAVQFLRDQWRVIDKAADSGRLTADEVASPDVYFVPSLSGLGAPHWDPKAKGAVFGLTRDTSKAQLVRAALEGVAFQVVDLIDAMQADSEQPLSSLGVDGGAAANDVLMQFQADQAGITVHRPKNLETTAMGAAMFAGLGVGLFSDLSELGRVRALEKSFSPAIDLETRKRRQRGWSRAVAAVRLFSSDAEELDQESSVLQLAGDC